MKTNVEMNSNPDLSFADLNLNAQLTKALADLGYTTPTPIQAQTIPALLQNRDVLGQAQTGTGKTAAFALPILQKIKPQKNQPQALVLVPTRELALQVTEAFKTYAKNIPNFRSLAVYGGQGFGDQLRTLREGVQIVIGTPGRIMDHMRRGSLDISAVDYLVLDEADEMLRMGFAEDVEWILKHTPSTRQTALFSATMPKEILEITKNFMHDFIQVTIPKQKVDEYNINQRYIMVNQAHKQAALERVLEAENFDAVLIFTRTKMSSSALADYLKIKGYACAALNGDMAQKQREQTIRLLKSGKLNIIVATDVAARGLDVSRISHVINYDIPHDIEAYIHRIGRTGRAGRKGDTILFLTPREQRMMFAIEKATNQKIKEFKLPSVEEINKGRMTRFQQRITDALQNPDLNVFVKLIKDYQKEHRADPTLIAAALASLVQSGQDFVLKNDQDAPQQMTANENVARFDRKRSHKRSNSSNSHKKSWSNDKKPWSNDKKSYGHKKQKSKQTRSR